MTTRPAALLVLVLVGVGLGACGPEEEREGADGDRPVAEAPGAPVRAEPTESAAPDAAGAWTVQPDRVGPVRFGMTIEEAAAAAPGAWSGSSAASEECDFGRADAAPASLSFMIVEGVVVRADVVDDPGARVTTAAGVGVGDSEDRVRAAYPGVTEMPHKYTDGRYLVVNPGPPADTALRIVFETDGSVVTRYRAGLEPQVEWVEGCL